MQKFSLFLVAMGFACSGFAVEENYLEGSVSCKSRPNGVWGATLKARNMRLPKPNEGSIWDPVVEFGEENSDEVEMGRRDSIDADKDYTPQKYKNHSQFNLTKLVNTESFSDFYPDDSCVLKWIVPNDVFVKVYPAETKVVKFVTPLTVGCDQSGTTITLDCQVTPRK